MTLITFQDGKPLFRDGKVGTEQACCCGCACQMPLPSGMVPHVSAVVTFPDIPGDCPSGDYPVELDLTLQFGAYYGCVEIDLGEGIVCAIEFYLHCTDGQWYGNPVVFTGPCSRASYTCTIGNGGFIGTGETYALPSSKQDGTCLPTFGEFSAELPLDIVYTFTISFA